MAKGNMLLGTLRGSIGDVTFTRVEGKQVSKAKATTVRNPKTQRQIYQRMFFATISKAKSAMKMIVDHSFENVPIGTKSLSYFQSKNVAIFRKNVNFDYQSQQWVANAFSYVPPKTPGMTFNKYRMSEGSLSPCNVMPFLKLSDYSDFDITGKTCMPPFTNNVPQIETLVGSTEWQRVLLSSQDERLRNEQARPGDYITAVFISAKQNDINEAGAGVFYPCYFHYVRFKVVQIEKAYNDSYAGMLVLLPSNIDGKQVNLPNYINFLDEEEGTLPIMGTYYRDASNTKLLSAYNFAGTYSVSVTDTKGNPIAYESIMPLIDEDDVILAGTWIHSRPVGSKLLLSTQDMILADPSGDVYDLNLGLDDAFDAWTQEVVPVGDAAQILEGGTK